MILPQRAVRGCVAWSVHFLVEQLQLAGWWGFLGRGGCRTPPIRGSDAFEAAAGMPCWSIKPLIDALILPRCRFVCVCGGDHPSCKAKPCRANAQIQGRFDFMPARTQAGRHKAGRCTLWIGGLNDRRTHHACLHIPTQEQHFTQQASKQASKAPPRLFVVVFFQSRSQAMAAADSSSSSSSNEPGGSAPWEGESVVGMAWLLG